MILCLLPDFDKKVKDSKAAAEDALKNIDDIQDIITEAFDKTSEAKGTLIDAKTNADDALIKAIQADELAKNASANAASIKNDADLLYQNATNLNVEAELMGERVQVTKIALKTLLDETRSNDSFIHQAKEKVCKYN